MEKDHRLPRMLFSLLLSAATLFGRHLHITSPYFGRMHDNYILPFGWTDLLLLALLTALFTFLLGILVRALDRAPGELCTDAPALAGRRGRFFLILLLLFACWLPYLLHYSPGFLFTETVISLEEAIGEAPLDNRNPVLFTLFLRLCFLLTGDLTATCLLFSLTQMLCMAATLSYLI